MGFVLVLGQNEVGVVLRPEYPKNQSLYALLFWRAGSTLVFLSVLCVGVFSPRLLLLLTPTSSSELFALLHKIRRWKNASSFIKGKK